MGVLCKPINVILNLESVDKKYPGGRKLLLLDFSLSVGRTHCFDDYLYRISVDTLEEANKMVRYFKSLGLVAEEEVVEHKHLWTGDMCIINTGEGALADCNWLTYDKDTNVAKHSKDTSREIISEENVLETFKEKTKLKKDNTFELLTQYLKQGYLQISFRKNYWEYLFLLIQYKKETQPNITTKSLFFFYFILWNDYVAFFVGGFMAYLLGWYYFFIVLLIYLLINRLVFNNIGKFFLARQVFQEMKLFEELLDNEKIAITTTMKYKPSLQTVPFVIIKSSDWEKELKKALVRGFLPDLLKREAPEKTQNSESVGLADHLFLELDEEDELAKHIPEGVDLSDPEVREFWKGIQEMRDRGHYSFVHYLLRDLALEHSDTFSKMIVQAHRVPNDNPFVDLWLENGGSEDDLEKDTFKPRFRSLPGGDILIIMKMPKVVLPNEAEYIGINLKTKEKLSFYTFELTREGKYVLCKWMRGSDHKPVHYLLSKAYESSGIDIFYDGILKLTTQNE